MRAASQAPAQRVPESGSGAGPDQCPVPGNPAPAVEPRLRTREIQKASWRRTGKAVRRLVGKKAIANRRTNVNKERLNDE